MITFGRFVEEGLLIVVKLDIVIAVFRYLKTGQSDVADFTDLGAQMRAVPKAASVGPPRGRAGSRAARRIPRLRLNHQERFRLTLRSGFGASTENCNFFSTASTRSRTTRTWSPMANIFL